MLQVLAVQHVCGTIPCPSCLQLSAALHVVVPQYSLSIFCVDGQHGGARVGPKRCCRPCWLFICSYLCPWTQCRCAFGSCRHTVMPHMLMLSIMWASAMMFLYSPPPVNQMPSLMICQSCREAGFHFIFSSWRCVQFPVAEIRGIVSAF